MREIGIITRENTRQRLGVNMDKDDKSTATDNDLATLQQHIVQLEEALADYAQRFGLTDKARAALKFHSTFEVRKMPN